MLAVLNIWLLALDLYLLQEGRSQLARPDLGFFVDFPTAWLPLAYLALALLIANFAILGFTIARRLRKRRWPWVTTAAVTLILGLFVWKLGFDGIRTIVDPAAAPTPSLDLR